ncbi:hypothetical protein CLHOM_06250 [Clostridium homopropionicum DSM 5847]|uniref:Uncharacterized protein n=1 Tax=Clostridium homopropionicum DSM 5847 TaxID=1121318 RepID=A0A0L6ZDK9_9CLOT|nr:hypothetical protein [Clostridium homopropionicum]KOA21037.1 hypothetical protein CLHOM_06250 [Clostridium homopropionicum DSM 5847]SFF98828.1 hypothetical protein SAMN04488501_10495 [Clostridium homopropionicum]
MPNMSTAVDNNYNKRGLINENTFDKIVNELPKMNSIDLYIMYDAGEPLLDKNLTNRIKNLEIKPMQQYS